MIRKIFFRKYGRIIHFKNLGDAVERYYKAGKINTHLTEQTLRAKKRKGTAEFNIRVSEDLSTVLKAEGIFERTIFTPQELEDNPILSTKPFVEYALLPENLWQKINANDEITISEKKQMKEISRICQQIYRETCPSLPYEKQFGQAISKIANDL